MIASGNTRLPLLGLGLPRWEFDPNLDLNYHLPQVNLPTPAGQLELQRLVGDLMSQPLDRAHPLWRFYCVENYQGGCALVPVLHHCIADGLALVQVLLAMTDPQPEASVFQDRRHPFRPPRTDGAAPFRPWRSCSISPLHWRARRHVKRCSQYRNRRV
jgi:hypothetical protein